jgi:omega-6 fatty acid desaturase / acyl-lipid omega-6 desaturase (Delta-12 desaturase)
MEATKPIRQILGDKLPVRPNGNPPEATWREAMECIYVEEDDRKGVFWFNNKF